MAWSPAEEVADMNLLKFSKGQCKVLHVGKNNHTHQYTLGAGCLESSLAEKDVGTLGGQGECESAVCPRGKGSRATLEIALPEE